MRKNGRYLQNVYAKMPVPHVALCVCCGTMRAPDSHNEYDILKHARKQSILKRNATNVTFHSIQFIYLLSVRYLCLKEGFFLIK